MKIIERALKRNQKYQDTASRWFTNLRFPRDIIVKSYLVGLQLGHKIPDDFRRKRLAGQDMMWPIDYENERLPVAINST